jgi:oligopeptide/dipeptide ABC transporter ATP-binding protein
MTEILKAENISKNFYQGNLKITAVDQINLELKEGETLGLAGESGSGKSTLGKVLIGLLKPTSGKIFLNGKSLAHHSRLEKAKLIQMVFQDWQSSLNPKMTISKILSEAWIIHKLKGSQLRQKLIHLSEDFELDPTILNRTPRELSGGQLQRVTIARALSINPKILIADEPTSSLDTSLRRQVLNLLKKKIHQMNLSLLMISHDIEAILSIVNKVLIMFRGKIVETTSPDQLLQSAVHPYSLRLIRPNHYSNNASEWEQLNENFSWNQACPFTSVCRNVMNICHKKVPPWKKYDENHWALCHF